MYLLILCIKSFDEIALAKYEFNLIKIINVPNL